VVEAEKKRQVLAEAEKKQIITEKKKLLQEKQKKRLEELKKNKKGGGKSTALSNPLLDEGFVKKAFKQQVMEFMNIGGRLSSPTTPTPDLNRARKPKVAREKATTAEAEELIRQQPGQKKHISEDNVEGDDIYVDEERASVYQGEVPLYFTQDEEDAANGIDPNDL
jgi:hypothetical protein